LFVNGYYGFYFVGSYDYYSDGQEIFRNQSIDQSIKIQINQFKTYFYSSDRMSQANQKL